MNPNPVPIGGSNPPKPALSGGGGGSTFDPMEARVARLEEDMREIKADLKALRSDMAELKPVRLEVAEIKGRLSQIPTSWQIFAMNFGLLAAAWGLARFGAH